MPLTVISVNLDTLYITVHGGLNSKSQTLLEAGKLDAQDSDEQWAALTALDNVAGGVFHVQRSGVRAYPWVIKNSRFIVKCSNRGGCRPSLEIDIISSLLYEYELHEINVMVNQICLFLLEDDYRIKVRRADLALDFQSPLGWSFPALQDVKTRARKCATYAENSKITGITWGMQSSPLQIVMYQKSETLLADNKEWMRDIWASSGVYDPEIPVNRIEFRFQRELLRELKDHDGNSLNDLTDLLESVADLADYVISGEKPYFRVLDPVYSLTGLHSGHTERMQDAGWWSTLKTTFRAALTRSQGRKRVQAEAKSHYHSAVKRMFSHASRAAAIAREQGWHPAKNPVSFLKDVAFAYFQGDLLHWAELVNEKHRSMRTEFSPPEEIPAWYRSENHPQPPEPLDGLLLDALRSQREKLCEVREKRKRLMSVLDESGEMVTP